jgi:RimJ/RimL family protein N-acetyltransferase
MEAVALPLRPTSDGVVTIRPSGAGDRERLIAGRDQEWHQWLGPGDDDPRPTACIVVDGEVVGWVDYETDHEWLERGEVSMGYNVFAPYRGNGYASRAVELLIRYLAERTSFHTATLSIDAANAASLAVAKRTGFRTSEPHSEQLYFKRPVRQQEAR